MAYLDEVTYLDQDDPNAAIKLARRAMKAGELTSGNSEALLMLQTDPSNSEKVLKELNKLLPPTKKSKKEKTPKVEAEVKSVNTDADKVVLIGSTLEADEVVLTADTLADTMRLAARALAAARGTTVRVGPFSDQLIRRTYTWVKGPPGEVAAVLEELSRGDIGFVAVPVVMKAGK